MFKECQEILGQKSYEFGTEEDSLYSFKKIGELTNLSKFKILEVILLDKLIPIIRAIEKNPNNPQISQNKIKHSINYLGLLLPLLEENKKKGKDEKK